MTWFHPQQNLQSGTW